MEDCGQSNYQGFDCFRLFLVSSVTYFLKDSVQVSRKVASKSSFRGKRSLKI